MLYALKDKCVKVGFLFIFILFITTTRISGSYYYIIIILSFRQPSYVASPVALYAATHADLIISSPLSYTNLNHAELAVLSPALHVLKHNVVMRIWTANQRYGKWYFKRLS